MPSSHQLKTKPPVSSRFLFPLLLIVFFLFICPHAEAQIERRRANPGGPVEDVFWATQIIGTSSVTNLPKKNINFSIHHVFGIATNGIDDLFGLDGSANIRFGLDYGVTDRLSVGFGRSRFDKLYDFRFKANVLRQTKDNKMPIELALKGDIGMATIANGLSFKDKLNYFASVMIARKFSEKLSLQVSPMYAHFNTVYKERGPADSIIEEENAHLAIGLAGKFAFIPRAALIVEYVPVLGERSDGTKDTFAVGLDYETGGHVFQVFATTSQGLTEQHLIARNVDDFFSGDFRFGFNVHRVF